MGRSEQKQRLVHLIDLLSSNPSTLILVQGKAGTDGELVAQHMPALGLRAAKPFNDINSEGCSL